MLASTGSPEHIISICPHRVEDRVFIEVTLDQARPSQFICKFACYDLICHTFRFNRASDDDSANFEPMCP